jgi:hypothetical protein
MSVSTFMDMRAHVRALEQRHRVLRTCCVDECQRLELDARVRRTAQHALATIALYEEEPMRERAAIGAMYQACEAGLATLAVLGSLRARGELYRTLQETIRDLQALISELFEWLVPLAKPPGPRVEH